MEEKDRGSRSLVCTSAATTLVVSRPLARIRAIRGFGVSIKYSSELKKDK
jgi:hypothetical protein